MSRESSTFERELFIRTLTRATASGTVSRQMAEAMRDVTFEPGDVLYRRGDPPHELYMVMSGAVELRAPGQMPYTFGERSVVGVLDVVQDSPRRFEAIATASTHCLCSQAEDFFELLEDNFDFLRDFLLGGADRLRSFLPDLGPRAIYIEHGDVIDRPLSALGAANFIERLLVLNQVPSLKRSSTQALVRLAQLTEPLELPRGQPLWESGAPLENSLYVLAKGRLQFGLDEAPASMTKQGLVASLSLFGVKDAPFQVLAEEPSLLLHIPGEHLLDAMEDHFDLARSLLAWQGHQQQRLLELRMVKAAQSDAA